MVEPLAPRVKLNRLDPPLTAFHIRHQRVRPFQLRPKFLNGQSSA